MIQNREPDRGALLRDVAGITAAFQAAARDALERHKRLGESIVIWREGRVVEVTPDQIDAERERAELERAELERAELEAGLR